MVRDTEGGHEERGCQLGRVLGDEEQEAQSPIDGTRQRQRSSIVIPAKPARGHSHSSIRVAFGWGEGE